jgi:hypothetical protein
MSQAKACDYPYRQKIVDTGYKFLRVVRDPTRKTRLTRGPCPGHTRALPWFKRVARIIVSKTLTYVIPAGC